MIHRERIEGLAPRGDHLDWFASAFARHDGSESALNLDLATDSAWAELIRNITDRCRQSD